MVFAYHNVLNGFAAKLSAEHVKVMENMDGFLFARPKRMYLKQTTHTPNFLRLHQNLGFWGGSNYGKGVIIGVLDSGTTPNHPSFNDNGVPPPPAKWKGKCEVEGCNWTAVGMAPLTHVAMYKVCMEVDCPERAIIAGLDVAVEDGVDVISISIGGDSLPFYQDGIALGAFTAIQKGIFVACSAGNSGPFNTSLENEAPWILTVGASTIDRKIVTSVSLGNKEVLDGESSFHLKDFP
ncbi:hypothetical protein L1987_56300 [Smallanthus sonchifolius]|uniref:Uncharacterized protein n=1 Tax=Smallanthus sonchifolius TaxID=185202 RepID=A0ACB9EC15_9ASTR|nr:hypothetical protein L1987_56300 [Smallanthus sonchifolius]